MKQLYRFLKSQILFILIYCGAAVLVIGYIALSNSQLSVRYPVYAAVFFLVFYLVTAAVEYFIHIRNVKRLMKNKTTAHSYRSDYEETYEAMNEIHIRYQNELAVLRQKSCEDQRLVSAFIHNLKTPVTVSSIMMQRAQSGEISEQEALVGVSEQLERLTGGLNALLDLKRLEEFQNDYQPQAVNLTEEMNRIIHKNKSLFIHSHVYPKWCSSDEKVMVLTDSKWNEILINQIISNGVKYSMASQDESIEDASQSRYLYFNIDQQGQETVLSIRDEGIGICEADIPKVFDAFFTGENGRAGYNSSGIGLYLCKRICKGLGQKIAIRNVDSEATEENAQVNNSNHGCIVTITYLSKL